MTMTAPLVLPSDVMLVPVGDLSSSVRQQLAGEEGDYAVTRLRSRIPSSVVDAQAAALLQAFRSPKTVVEAVLEYSLSNNVDPEKTLDDAFPLLQRLASARFLVPAD